MPFAFALQAALDETLPFDRDTASQGVGLVMEIGIVRPRNIGDEMRASYLDYSMSVIVARALPDVRDGLKPVHRRVLYAMRGLGLSSNASYRKSAGTVGEVLKLYHPHSDAAAYDTLVRMAQDFSLRYPLVDGQGNFGSIDGDSAAAMRYTEARLTALAEELLIDIDKDTVDFKDNYDSSTREPIVLPARIPNLLINGTDGIAVGMATKIPPHNLREVCDGLIYLIDNPDATAEDLAKIIPGPDFPTGGIILGREEIALAQGTGRGRITLRGKVHVEEGRGNRLQINITELPYQVNKAALVQKIAELVKEDRIQGITDINDYTDRRGMRVTIDLKKDAHPQKIINQLYKYTQLQTTFSVNSLALVDGQVPRVLTLKQMMRYFIEHRQEVIRRRTEYELGRAKAREHILQGLKIALDHLDEVINTIRNSASADAARTELIQQFSLTEIQAQAILDMQLRRLAALERQRLEDELKEVQKTIADLEGILANPKRILRMIKSDLKQLKDKYGDDRRTTIVESTGEINAEDLIPNTAVAVSITKRGYIKRLPDNTYRTQRRGGKGITGMTTREADAVGHLITCNNLDNVLFFTNKGKAFQLKAHEIPDAGRTARGLPLINLINIEPNEKITEVLVVKNFNSSKYLTMITTRGKIKRARLSEFSAVRSSGLIAMGLEDGDEMVEVRISDDNDDIFVVTASGQCLRFESSDVRVMGRTASGVNAIRLAKGDRVIAMEVGGDDDKLLMISERGQGKRTQLSEFPAHHRAGGGVKAFRVTSRTGKLVAARKVPAGVDVLVVTGGGIVMRVAAASVSEQGRNAQGVSVMSIKEDDAIASIAVVDPTAADSSLNGHKG